MTRANNKVAVATAAPKESPRKTHYHGLATGSSPIVRTERGGVKRLDFAPAVKAVWRVKRDECRDEYIPLRGRTGLDSGGLDHVYALSRTRLGVWLSGRQILQRVRTLQGRLSGLLVEQLGDGEAILSAPVAELDTLCRAVKARRRRQVSQGERQRLQRMGRIATIAKAPSNGTPSGPRIESVG